MLSREEIQKLFAFTRKKRVRFIDVQVEIVDHLATNIEELLASSPTLNFDTALQKVYSQFPITGFNKIIEEKSKSLHFFWYRKISSYLSKFLKIPKMISLVCLFLSLYGLASLVDLGDFCKTIVGVLMIFSVYVIFINNSHIGQKEVSRYLSVTTYFAIASTLSSLLMQPYLQLFFYEQFVTGYWQVILCGYSSIYLIMIYGLYVEIPEYIKSDVMAPYQELLIQAS